VKVQSTYHSLGVSVAGSKLSVEAVDREGKPIDAFSITKGPGSRRWRRGDLNADEALDLADPVAALFLLFGRGGPAPPCPASADADANGGSEIADVVYLLRHVFLGGAAPEPPELSAVESAGC
jgi:hypothetical protein